jgi:ABC-type transport system involved in multi-copper enzyme maturation permease subunit
MSVLTLPAQPGQDTAPRPLPWRRMAWVTWRQQRATLISIPAVLGAVAIFLVLYGLKVHHDYAALVKCPLTGQAGQSGSGTCQQLFSRFNSTDWPIGNTCGILMSLAPVLIGAFAGAPLLARELETGTYRYAWTQGFGRERQTIAKLALVGLTLAAVAGAFGELFAWFFQPFLYTEQMNVLTDGVFSNRGLVFPAFTLLAFAIGAFFGMLLRRIIPAMAATLGFYLVVRLVAWGVRKYYPVAVVTSNSKIFSQFETPSLPGFPWILSTWVTGPGGQPASQSIANQILNGPGLSASGSGPSTGGESVPPGYTEWTRWIPLSHYWPMQFIEAGWLVILAIVFFAATVSLVRRRAA